MAQKDACAATLNWTTKPKPSLKTDAASRGVDRSGSILPGNIDSVWSAINGNCCDLMTSAPSEMVFFLAGLTIAEGRARLCCDVYNTDVLVV